VISFYLSSFLAEIQSRIFPTRLSFHHAVPYFSQYESRELVDDPKWKQSGAKTKDEYAYWSHNSCGMACLKMILKYKLNKEIPIVTLAKKCTEYGGYISKKDEAEGLFYEPFCLFVKEEFNINASVAPFLTLKRILFEISKNNLVITSAHPDIRDRNNPKPKGSGGHLVLITGYDLKKKTITIHNPSGSYQKSQEHYEMSFKEFKKFFAERGIVIYM